MSFLKILWSLTPIGAVVNILARSNEHGAADVVETIRGSAPYYPPNDSGQAWQKVSDDPLEYQRVVRKGKSKPALIFEGRTMPDDDPPGREYRR